MCLLFAVNLICEIETLMKDQAKTREELLNELQEVKKELVTLKKSYQKDLIDSRLTLDALRESEARFQSFFEGVPVGYQSLDENGCFIEVNPEWLRTFGYSREEVIGKWFGDFLAPEFVDAFSEQFPLFKSKGKIHSEYQMIHKEGSRLFIAFQGRIGYKPNGDFKQTHCILSDVTEVRRISEALRLSEEKYRSLFENVQDVFYQINLDGIIQEVSPSIKHFSEFNRDEILGTDVANLYFNPDDRELLINSIMQNGELRDYELIFKTKHGEKRVVSLNARLVTDDNGNPHHIDGALRDITERKKNEAALQENERLLRESQEIARLGSFVWDISSGLWTSSNILDDIFGIDDTYIRSFDGWAALIHPDRREIMVDYVANEVLGKRQRFDKEYKIINQRSRKELWVHGLAELETDKNNQPLKLIGTITDITKRQQAEQELL
jgi:PAS domain S-box-containing protein